MATSSFDHLLDQLNDLDNDELEQIATLASRLRVSRSGKTLSHVESALLQKINAGLSQSDRNRMDVLVSKRQDESLSEKELSELQELTDQVEKIQVERLQALGQLATIRETSIQQLSEVLGL